MTTYEFTNWDADWVRVVRRDEEPGDTGDARLAVLDRETGLELVEAEGDEIWASVFLHFDDDRENLAETLENLEIQK
jgi:hypothetical protein